MGVSTTQSINNFIFDQEHTTNIFSYLRNETCTPKLIYVKNHHCTKHSGRVFENLGIAVADKTSNFLKNSLGNPKDELDNFDAKNYDQSR